MTAGTVKRRPASRMQTARQEVAAFVKVDRLALIRYGRVNNLEFRAIAISISSEHGQEIRVRFHDHVAIAPKQATVGQRCHPRPDSRRARPREVKGPGGAQSRRAHRFRSRPAADGSFSRWRSYERRRKTGHRRCRPCHPSVRPHDRATSDPGEHQSDRALARSSQQAM